MMCDKQLLEKFWNTGGQFYLLISPEKETKGIRVEGKKEKNQNNKTEGKLNSISGEFIEL